MSKVTLENLAGMIKKGFDENTEQHGQIFARLDKHDEEFEKINGRFEYANARLDTIETDIKEIKEDLIENLKIRVEVVERRIGIAV